MFWWNVVFVLLLYVASQKGCFVSTLASGVSSILLYPSRSFRGLLLPPIKLSHLAKVAGKTRSSTLSKTMWESTLGARLSLMQ